MVIWSEFRKLESYSSTESRWLPLCQNVLFYLYHLFHPNQPVLIRRFLCETKPCSQSYFQGLNRRQIIKMAPISRKNIRMKELKCLHMQVQVSNKKLWLLDKLKLRYVTWQDSWSWWRFSWRRTGSGPTRIALEIKIKWSSSWSRKFSKSYFLDSLIGRPILDLILKIKRQNNPKYQNKISIYIFRKKLRFFKAAKLVMTSS